MLSEKCQSEMVTGCMIHFCNILVMTEYRNGEYISVACSGRMVVGVVVKEGAYDDEKWSTC